MVEVAPFVAWEYSPDKVSLNDVVAPPFDVIPPDLLAALQKRSPHNFVHATIPGAGKGVPDPAMLAAADANLARWVAEGVVKPTPQEVMYAYETRFEHRGAGRRLRGVLLRLRIDPTYTTVLPHEQIFEKYSEGRLHLLRTTGTDLEPIQFLYAGKSAEDAMWGYIDGSQRAPDLEATGPDGVLHRYWRITDQAVIGTVVQGFKGRKAYIADGHHRYAAAVRYAQERREREYRPPKNAPWEYKFALMVNSDDPGLLILPTHRVLLTSPVEGAEAIVERWGKRFHVRPVALPKKGTVQALGTALEQADRPHTLGAWLGEAGQGYLLEAKDPVVPKEAAGEATHTWRTLDVVYLQHLAIGEALGVPQSAWADALTYTRDDAEAEALVRKKKAVAVLTHRPTRMPQLRAVADAGEKMPQKSTYFWPKTLSGVAFYRIGRPEGPPSRPRITS